jgi:hypothetical protein
LALRIRIASNTRRKAKERAMLTTVYAERMIMRSPWRLMTAKN